MNEVKFADAVYQASSSGGVVKVEFVNLAPKGESVEISNKYGIAMTIPAFVKLKETIDDLYLKLFPVEVEKKEEKPVFSKVSRASKSKKKKE